MQPYNRAIFHDSQGGLSKHSDAGDIPEFDKEFNILDDYEHPQFLLFKDGERTPRLHTSADDIVFVVFIET